VESVAQTPVKAMGSGTSLPLRQQVSIGASIPVDLLRDLLWFLASLLVGLVLQISIVQQL